MDSIESLAQPKEQLNIVITNLISIIALVFSVLAFIDSKKANRLQNRVNELDEKLKTLELNDKLKAQEDSLKACIEASIIKDFSQNYKLRLKNTGKSTAYNVNFEIEDEYNKLSTRDKVPFEFLEPDKYFEEYFGVYIDGPSKINITLTWNNVNGDSDMYKQLLSI